MTLPGRGRPQAHAEDAAKAAYEYGRGGSFLSNEFGYIGAFLRSTNWNATVLLMRIRQSIVGNYTKQFNEMLMEPPLKSPTTALRSQKAAAPYGRRARLFELVMASLDQSAAQNSPVSADYALKSAGDPDIDLQGIYDSIFTEPIDAIYDTAQAR
jgi:hypothetical protein